MATAALALLTLAGLAASETVHGVVVYSRHGDRTTKHYGSQQLTALGASQNFLVGSDYRSRYISSSATHPILNISPDRLVQSQVYASAPDQSILLNTATAFLQGLYPPLESLNTTGGVASVLLNNGSETDAPLNGYQYVTLHGENADSPDAIWIKGDDGCPVNLAAAKTYFQSPSYLTTLSSTKSFYSSFYETLSAGVYDYTPEEMSFRNAYDIFDLLNVARIHNLSSPALQISESDMFQLRTLADAAEFGYNFNATQPARSMHAQTLVSGILTQLNLTVTSKAKTKFSLLAGSYDTFQAFFGLTNLTALSDDFYGLPDYASTMAFELFTESNTTSFPSDVEEEMRVRFLFQNSTYGELTSWPLFGTGEETLSWPRFKAEMEERAIGSAAEWCGACASTLSFCAAFKTTTEAVEGGSGGGMSNAVAGVIGAFVALGVVALVAGVLFVVMRKRRAAPAAEAPASGATAEKASLRSGSAAGSGSV